MHQKTLFDRDQSDNTNKKLAIFFSKAQNSLGLCSGEVADHLNISLLKYKAVLSSKKEVGAMPLERFLKKLNLSFDTILHDQVDYQVLSDQYKGRSSAVPKRYLKAALSSRRTLINLFAYLRDIRGPREEALVFRRFQLTKEHFENPDASINIKLKCDILSFLQSKKYKESDFFQMGQYSYSTNKNSFLDKIIRSERSIISCYQNIMENLANKYFDKNFIYKLTSINKNFCTIKITQNSDVATELEIPILGSSLQRINRAGVISSFSSYLSLPSCNITELKTEYYNPEEVNYRIDFPLDQYKLQ